MAIGKSLLIGITLSVSLTVSGCKHVDLGSTMQALESSRGIPENVVLVHGAFLTSTVWTGTAASLRKMGFHVFTVDMPGRDQDGLDPKEVTLATAVKKVCDEAPEQGAIFVGHSQGGAVITQAVAECPDKIKGLVYISAVVPKNGENSFDALDPQRDSGLGAISKFNTETGLIELNPGTTAPNGPVERLFFQELRGMNPNLANETLAQIVNEPLGIGMTKLHYDEEAFASKPSFYLETRDDHAISVETQRSVYEKRVNSKVYSFFAPPISGDVSDPNYVVSHCSYLARPDAIAAVVLDVARSLNATE